MTYHLQIRLLGTLVLFVSLFASRAMPVESQAAEQAKPTFELTDLFESVRIPNITVATDGTVLAFASSGKLLRRSTDGGATWQVFDIDGYYESHGIAWGVGRFVSVGSTSAVSGEGAIYTLP